MRVRRGGHDYEGPFYASEIKTHFIVVHISDLLTLILKIAVLGFRKAPQLVKSITKLRKKAMFMAFLLVIVQV